MPPEVGRVRAYTLGWTRGDNGNWIENPIINHELVECFHIVPDEFLGSKQAYCLRSEEIEISRYKNSEFFAETDYIPVMAFDLC